MTIDEGICDILGSFSNDDGEGTENVTIKMNSRCFKRGRTNSLYSWRPHPSLERETKIRRRLFTSSIKRPISKFHIRVVQWRQSSVPKRVMYVQSCCFGYKDYCFLDVLVAVAVVVANTPYFPLRAAPNYVDRGLDTRGVYHIPLRDRSEIYFFSIGAFSTAKN